ncbi:type IV pilus modification protein PilV [Pseudomonas sp. NA-150]|uniref:type IV pilus modification protein PilV n=1 Tax=Pseudomonas sp. NA-150 TaxID=3367525 RepID=UPI0037C596F1
MFQGNGYFQTGVALIEVMITLLILAVGLLGVAMTQLNALKYSDSAMLHSQASFIAYDMLDRIRANPDANYTLTSLASAPGSGNLSAPRDQDLYDFASNIKAFAGANADASISKVKAAVTITLTWNDSRAADAVEDLQTFTLQSRVAADSWVAP